jgi:hypothetical protein
VGPAARAARLDPQSAACNGRAKGWGSPLILSLASRGSSKIDDGKTGTPGQATHRLLSELIANGHGEERRHYRSINVAVPFSLLFPLLSRFPFILPRENPHGPNPPHAPRIRRQKRSRPGNPLKRIFDPPAARG